MMMMKRRQRHSYRSRAHGDHKPGQYHSTRPYVINLLEAAHQDFCGLSFVWGRLEDDDGSSRRTRLLRLCSYLQHKYKHMCRQERASIRQKKYRYAFRKALLHAASNNPDSAGQLIQELHGASRRWSRYFHTCSISAFAKLIFQFTWSDYFHPLSTAASRLSSFEIWLLLI